MNDVFEAARDKIGPGLIHSFFNSEGSYSRAGEYYILSPLRGDTHVGSFSINEDTGQYFDHATDESGDFIDLVSKAKGISLKDAAETIISESGGVFIHSDNGSGKKKKSNIDLSPPQIPIPDSDKVEKSLKNRVFDPWCIEHWGRPEGVSKYYNASGDWVFIVCRFLSAKGKNDILFYLGQDDKWYSKHHDDLKPFPPYGVEKLKKSKLPVLIVEGEKCGRASAPGYDVISWIGGSNQVHKTTWKALRKKEVYIWPDADSQMDKNKEFYLSRELQPGMKAAFYLKSQLPQAKILEVYRAKPIEDNPGGWDIVDFIEDGGDPLKFIEEYTPYNSVAVEIDPYQVYRKFIEHYYDHDSLEQVNSGFWHYIVDNHFWRKIKKNDIYCNFQRWLEDTGLQWVIAKKMKATTFINETKQYIDRHSLGYINQNPFKEAAMSPYIHLKNGAVRIKNDKSEWLPREDYGETFFKKLYPINSLDFSFNYKNYKKVKPEKECPGFYFFCKEIVPREYLVNITSDEKVQEIIDETMIFISQIMAYSLSPIKNNEYFFGIYGNERTGKSFLLKIIKSVIGSEFCVERKISDMDNRFASSVLWGKKIFIEPDLKTRKPLPEDFIKAYAGEQEITIEEKNLPAIDGVKISMALFFISNYEFHTKGMEGLARRMIMIPYKNDIAKHDPRLLDKILGEVEHGKESGELAGKIFDERPAIMALALQAWDKYCKDDYMIKSPEWVQQEKDIWLVEANSVLKFTEDTYFFKDENTTINRSEMYKEYKDWCKEEGRIALGKKNFYEEIRRDKRIDEIKSGGFESFVVKPDIIEDDIPF